MKGGVFWSFLTLAYVHSKDACQVQQISSGDSSVESKCGGPRQAYFNAIALGKASF
jgi:hypothetical protein